jgi:hypothetical protein
MQPNTEDTQPMYYEHVMLGELSLQFPNELYM